jgi:hypothetical protein
MRRPLWSQARKLWSTLKKNTLFPSSQIREGTVQNPTYSLAQFVVSASLSWDTSLQKISPGMLATAQEVKKNQI